MSNPGPSFDIDDSGYSSQQYQHLQKAYTEESMDYSSAVGSDAYYTHDGANSSVTGGPGAHASYQEDATETVHEAFLALLYLLSNPDEFKKALHTHPPRGATTLSEWNAEYEEDDESVITSATAAIPLPFVVFADDAEVVLPQAHTASQLFGIERVEGIELEAAAGVPALSQLFLRWLALMPGGDHLNIIDPPGLTVMRIAGGRYRVTAAHRCVWTWMNEFASLLEEHPGIFGEEEQEKKTPPLQVGDLVSLTIIDVFETDNQGKLLSYCPTFDNRAVTKTNQATETIKKGSGRFFSMLGKAQKYVARSKVNERAAAQLERIGIMQQANSFASNVKSKVGEAVNQYSSSASPGRPADSKHEDIKDLKGFEQAISAAEQAATAPR
mmetsp:Transcript_18794/g.46568  ORF Transcript_18794/g.46568 Transcript_18794/m.46568 type:complete len:384 (+) Transcript_18794:1153-2304(+)